MGTIGAALTPQMPKQVWQSEDGTTFETEEECVAYEKVASVLNDLCDDYIENTEEVVEKLGLQSDFVFRLREGFIGAKELLKYAPSFQILADLLHGRVKLD